VPCQPPPGSRLRPGQPSGDRLRRPRYELHTSSRVGGFLSACVAVTAGTAVVPSRGDGGLTSKAQVERRGRWCLSSRREAKVGNTNTPPSGDGQGAGRGGAGAGPSPAGFRCVPRGCRPRRRLTQGPRPPAPGPRRGQGVRPAKRKGQRFFPTEANLQVAVGLEMQLEELGAVNMGGLPGRRLGTLPRSDKVA